jgi:hypothetical protein
MSSDFPSPFYALFEGAEEVSLIFPVNGDSGGPTWNEDGNLDLSHCHDHTDEKVAVVELGEGHYRIAERCFGPFSELRLYWGDEFMATRETNGELILRHVIVPRKFEHYRFIASGFDNDNPIADILHSLEGGWEKVAGGMLTLTTPAPSKSEFERILNERGLFPGVIRLEV